MTDELLLQEQIEDLRSDRRHGASELARLALHIAADAAHTLPAQNTADLLEQLHRLAHELAEIRPSMAPLFNLLMQWRQRLDTMSRLQLTTARESAAAYAREIITTSEQAVAALARNVRKVVDPNNTIITHSLSSSLLEVFHQLRKESIRVIITESRPLLEGHQMATHLSAWNIPTTLITEAQIGLFMAQADIVLVGADSLLEDGSVVNKAGTYLLALAAHDCNVPFYVCSESFKQRDAGMGPLELENMNPDELRAPYLPHLSVSNIYYDITPARLVTAWINEHGIVYRETPDA